MLDLLSETIENPVIFSHEAQVLDLTFQRWVCPASVDIWRSEVLRKYMTEPKFPQTAEARFQSGGYQHAELITELSVSSVSCLLFYKFR